MSVGEIIFSIVSQKLLFISFKVLFIQAFAIHVDYPFKKIMRNEFSEIQKEDAIWICVI